MEFATAQRRLVKSPPELWAEVSSEDSLGRRLSEFGEIRITRVEPETTVAWEGDRASGTVELAPAGWGTKVTLTATTAEAAVDEAATEAEPEAKAIAVARRVPGAIAEPEPVAIAEPEPEPIAQAPEPAPPRRGFFARLLRRAPKVPPAPAQTTPQLEIPAPPAPAPDPSPPAPGPEPPPPDPGPAPGPVPVPDPLPPAPEPAPPPQIGPRPDPPPAAAVIKAPLDADRTVAILSDVLDDLGAAHHRPFSRG